MYIDNLNNSPKTKVFVSYSSADRSLVIPIAGLLRANGSFVFQDIDSIQPGKRWRPEIEKALTESDLIVVFWCDHANQSNEVSSEWKSAIVQEKDILPLLLDRTPLPPELSVFQWIDFRDVIGANHRLISDDILPSDNWPATVSASSVFSIELILRLLSPVILLLLLLVILLAGALVYFYPSYTIPIIVLIFALVGCFILWARHRGLGVSERRECRIPSHLMAHSDNVYIAQKLETEILRRVAMRRNNDTKFS